jgi:hypothetical protein
MGEGFVLICSTGAFFAADLGVDLFAEESLLERDFFIWNLLWFSEGKCNIDSILELSWIRCYVDLA